MPLLWDKGYCSTEALLERLPVHKAAILRLQVLESRSLRAVGRELGLSPMTVSRREKAAPAALREQLALSASRGRATGPNQLPCPGSWHR
jgi:DNA-directed RNA polymerase specialized sigma subunit